MAEQHDRQAGMAGNRMVAHRAHIRNHPRNAVARRKLPERRVRGGGKAVAAMIMRIDMQPFARHARGKGGVARTVFGKAMAQKQDAARFAARRLMAQCKRRAGCTLERLSL